MICSVRMTTRGVFALIFVGALVAVTEGLEPRGKFVGGTPSSEDCLNPPMRKFGHDCCRLPKARIWGDLRGSLSLCIKKLKEDAKQEPQLMRQEAAEGEQPEMATTAEAPSESASTPATSTPLTSPRPPKRHGRFHPNKPHHLHQRPNDSCFMECVFEDQGFLVNKVLSKEALLTRLSLTLGRNEPWHVAAVAAVDTCYGGLQVASNGTCSSGSEEIFRCVFKQLFFNCPDWLQNDYCTSLKEFYQKCPNGPPPETMDTQTTAAPSEEEVEDAITTETEQQQ